MSIPTHPIKDPDEHISPWWLRTVLIVMVIGFAGLLWITGLAYKNAPPIPGQVVDSQGAVLATQSDISAGQAVFLKYGLMANGSGTAAAWRSVRHTRRIAASRCTGPDPGRVARQSL